MEYSIIQYGQLNDTQKMETVKMFIDGFGRFMKFTKDREILKSLYLQALNPQHIYEEDNAENKPNLDKVNHAPKFQVHAQFPDGWTVREPIADDEITVPGEFYTPLIICEQEQPIGYIGFNLFEPYAGEIPQDQYYQTVYSALRLPSTFHWDPYAAIKSTDTAETGIVDIWYLDENEINNHPGAMPDVPQFETIGILSYDKELEVYIGIAFLPGTVDRTQAEAIAQSIELSPLK